MHFKTDVFQNGQIWCGKTDHFKTETFQNGSKRWSKRTVKPVILHLMLLHCWFAYYIVCWRKNKIKLWSRVICCWRGMQSRYTWIELMNVHTEILTLINNIHLCTNLVHQKSEWCNDKASKLPSFMAVSDARGVLIKVDQASCGIHVPCKGVLY